MPANAGAAAPARFSERLFVAVQYLLPQHLLSRLVHRATRGTSAGWKNFLIRSFLRRFAVDMSEAAQPEAFAFSSFNAFFTRALRPGLRTIDSAANAFVSPVDGSVSQLGRIEGETLFQAKGRTYTLTELLAGDAQLAARFRDGRFATLYLAPFNYHRIHMPLAGRLLATTYVPGRLFSVNTVTAASVPRLFARNERVICVFDTSVGSVALILVGALFVGSMETVWAGEITPGRPRRIATLPSPAQPVSLARGEEMGRFNMGSTVIVLTQPGVLEWLPGVTAASAVRVGQRIGELK